MVRVSAQPLPLLRRPFSIHAVSKKRDSLEIFFARTGIGTALLAEKRVGERLDLIGPLGNGFLAERPGGGNQQGGEIHGPDRFPVPARGPEPSPGNHLAGKQVFLVGGGRGIAPLYFLAEELRRRGAIPIIFYGGRTKSDLPLLRKFKVARFDLLLSTEDGSSGFAGLISDVVEAELARLACLPVAGLPAEASGEEKKGGAAFIKANVTSPPGFPAQVYACGPEAMMVKIASLAALYGLPARFSLESIMGCGIGACWGCVRKIKRGPMARWVRVCEEGPVFDGSEIIWAPGKEEARG